MNSECGSAFRAVGRVLVAVALCSFIASPCRALADEGSYAAPGNAGADSIPVAKAKDETVYVYLDADGTVKKTRVEDVLANPGSWQIADVSSLSNIEAAQDSQTYSGDGPNIVWESGDQDVRYEGTTQEKAPVSLKIEYRFNGSVITARELAGKSGHVAIRYAFSNDTVAMDGTYTPFAVLTGMLLENDCFSNVEVTNGKVIEDENRTIVIGYALPGLQQNLGARDALNIGATDYFEVEADVTDFELNSTLTLASSGFFDGVGTPLVDTSGYSGANAQLVGAMQQLACGSDELVEGLGELSDGAGALDGQVRQLQGAVSALAAGSGELEVGLKSAAAGVGELSAVAGAVDAGGRQLAEGVASTKTAIDSTVQPLLLQCSSALASAEAELSAAGDVAAALDALADAGATAAAACASVEDAADHLDSASSVLAGMSSSMQAAVDKTASAASAASSAAGDLDEIARAVDDARAALDGIDTTGMTAGQIAAIQEAKDALGSAPVARAKGEAADAEQDASDARRRLEDLQSDAGGAAASLKSDAGAFSEDAEKLEADAETLRSIDAAEAPLSSAGAVATMAQYIAGAKAGVDSASIALEVISNGGTLPDGSQPAGLAGVLDLLGDDEAPGTLLYGANAVAEGLAALSGGDSGLPAALQGMSSLDEGLDRLDSAMPKLALGAQSLSHGATQAVEGSKRLAEGLDEFGQNGVSSITRALDEGLLGFTDQLDSIVDAGKAYTNFSGIADGTQGTVKFVYETDAIIAG